MVTLDLARDFCSCVLSTAWTAKWGREAIVHLGPAGATLEPDGEMVSCHLSLIHSPCAGLRPTTTRQTGISSTSHTGKALFPVYAVAGTVLGTRCLDKRKKVRMVPPLSVPSSLTDPARELGWHGFPVE